MATGNEIVTIGQAARYLGISTSGSLDSRPITLRQLKSMVDETKASSVKLPDGYTQLEYIESTGTQYIDTGVKLNYQSEVTAEFQFTEGYSTITSVFGVRNQANPTANHAYAFWRNGAKVFRHDMFTDSISISGPDATSRHVVKCVQNKVDVSGTSVEHDILSIEKNETSDTLAVFCCKSSGTAKNFSKMKLYSLDINATPGTTTPLNMVPAKRDSDGAIGLFETNASKFYGNEGTGSFVAGPEIKVSEFDTRLVTISQLKRIYIGPTIVSWADGTDEEISAMVDAADAGNLNLSDYWSAGDTRTVHLSEMVGIINTSETHSEQDVEFVLTDPGHYTLTNGNTCNFVVLQKDCLLESGAMNPTDSNSGGWDNSQRRVWCNAVYFYAIPDALRGIFKQFSTYAANGTGSTSIASTDYFALFSEKEIFGSTTYANSSAESKNSQLTWFKTSSNRIKFRNGSAYTWWGRSSRSGNSNGFCYVAHSGTRGWDYASNAYGIAPFGCI